jgi:hypothetical protein
MDPISLGIIILVGIILLLVGISKYHADKYLTNVAIERTMQVGGFIKGMLKKNKKK